MKTPRILATTVAAFLFTQSLHAQTWDGGGANANFNTANNWNPNAVPANNGTANLIFGGAVQITPSVNVNFDVNGVTFNNTASAFNLGTPGGTSLTVRGGGITNNDANTQTFSLPVTIAAGSTITAAAGGLYILDGLALGANTVTVGGGFDIDVGGPTGTGTLVKNGAGALDILRVVPERSSARCSPARSRSSACAAGEPKERRFPNRRPAQRAQRHTSPARAELSGRCAGWVGSALGKGAAPWAAAPSDLSIVPTAPRTSHKASNLNSKLSTLQ